MVRLKVDVIVAANGPAGYAAQAATRTIPIVIPVMSDPVGDGFVASLARPGGKLLKEALPTFSPMALLVDRSEAQPDLRVREAESAARVVGVQLHPIVEARSPGDLNGVFSTITKEGARAVFVVGGTMLTANRVQLAEHALKPRLPMMCHFRENVAAGCLMSYWASLTDLFRHAATYVDKILKGAKPGDIPVEQPTKFELVINLKTAKALGLSIPPSLLARADEVIE